MLQFFSTLCDSPVSADSSTLIWWVSKNRISAGIMFPVSSNTTSPGTNSVAVISSVEPSRTTLAKLGAIFLRASIAFSERYS